MAIMRGSMKPKTVTSGGAPSRPTGKAPVKTGGRTSGLIGSAGKAIGKKVSAKPSMTGGIQKKTFGKIGTGLARSGGMSGKITKSKIRGNETKRANIKSKVKSMRPAKRESVFGRLGQKFGPKIGSFARPSKPVTRKARPVPVKRRK